MAYNDSDAASIQTSVLSMRSDHSMETITPVNTTQADHPPPYSAHDPMGAFNPSSSDLRRTSTQSLVPLTHDLDGTNSKRRLLIIYIHGFMGNETSFRSFPAHVHNLVSVFLSSTHVVHTKIYPRYQSKSSIAVAAQNFSTWLSPHEDANTDVILIGHSAGGILAAEVALLASDSPEFYSPFKHRILGTINYDTPFLGMHPGVIRSGINSLFHPDPNPPPTPEPESSSSGKQACPSQRLKSRRSSGLTSSHPQDPNFNPAFDNDSRLSNLTGWKNASHFVFKHAKHLKSATQKLVTSYMDFGSCLSDFEGLKLRYSKIRILEEDNGDRRISIFLDGRMPPRVRFVNYYTASTGKITQKANVSQSDIGEASSSPTPGTVQDIELAEAAPMDASLPALQPDGSEYSIEDDQFSDNDSEISDLSDIDTFNDSASVISDATTAATSSAYVAPKDLDSPVFGQNDPVPMSPQSYLPASAFTLESQSHHAVHNRKNFFKSAVRQHNNVIKHNFHALKAQQKAEYIRLIREARISPMSHKAQIKAFVDSQRAERQKFVEIAKSDWKVMYEQLRQDLNDTVKAERKAWKESRKPSDEEIKHLTKEDRKLQRLDRISEKNQRKAERKSHKLERKLIKSAYKDHYDFSTTSVSKQVKSLSLDDQSVESNSQYRDRSLSPSTSTPSLVTSDKTGTSASFASSSTTLPPYPTNSQAAAPTSEKHSALFPQVTSPAESSELRSYQNKYEKEQGAHKGNKFCVRPPKDAAGNHDPTWLRVHMRGVDEVGAHCGLFFPLGPGEEAKTDGWSERYAWMVGDVADRIERWIGESMSEQLAFGLNEENRSSAIT